MPTGIYERKRYYFNCEICGSTFDRLTKEPKRLLCKKCSKRLSDKRYALEHKEQIKAYSQRPEVKEKKRESDRRYNEKNRDNIRLKQREYYKNHRD